MEKGIKEDCAKINQKLDELMIMMAKRYQVSLLTELFSKEYSNPIIQRKRPILVIVEDPFVTRQKNQYSNKPKSTTKEERSNTKDVVNDVFQSQEFLQVKQYQEKSKLWKNDYLITFDLEKECFDLESTDKEDDSDNSDSIGSGIHSTNKNNKVQDVQKTDLKEQPDSFKREVSEEDA